MLLARENKNWELSDKIRNEFNNSDMYCDNAKKLVMERNDLYDKYKFNYR